MMETQNIQIRSRNVGFMKKQPPPHQRSWSFRGRRPSLFGLFCLGCLCACWINFFAGFHHQQQQQQQQHPSLFVILDQSHHHPRGDQSINVTQTPTHHACDGYQGIYHVAMTDILGGVGTALIQLVLGQLLYAEHHQLKPWIHLGNTSQVIYDPLVHGQGPGVHLTAMVGRNASYVLPSRQHYRSRKDMIPGPPNNSTQPLQSTHLFFPGTGIWNHYFLPVSDFVPGDTSCSSKLYVTMDLYLITPGLHGFDTHRRTAAWRYDYLPEYSTQPYKPLHEWLYPQRQRAHDVWQRFRIRLQPHLWQRATEANPECSSSPILLLNKEEEPNTHRHFCLGLHIRHSDKAAGRRQVPVAEFLPYAQAFVQQQQQQNDNNHHYHIYIATDSTRVLEEIHSTWPADIRSRIRTLEGARRSSNQMAVFDMMHHDQNDPHGSSSSKHHHATNEQALVEIAALSRCHFLVHGLSALSEASIWMNLHLHDRSVNLEEQDHLDPTAFTQLIQGTLQGRPLHELPTPPKTNTFYEKLTDKTQHDTNHDYSSNDTCNHYVGILHIAVVDKDACPASAFFQSIVHQLQFAEQHQLRPWIHLAPPPLASPILYDSKYHKQVNVTVHAASYSRPSKGQDNGSWIVAPPPPQPHSYVIPGSNVWSTYFENAENLAEFPQSCSKKPIFVLNPEQVTDWMTQSAKSTDNMDEDSLLASRRNEAAMVNKYLRAKQPILDRAQEVNKLSAKEHCLAVHIEITGQGRNGGGVSSGSYIPYMEEFASIAGPNNGVIYIAADSNRALKYINHTASSQVNAMIRTQGKYVVRSKGKTIPPYVLDDHHRVNSEALVDIYAMSKCDFLLHGGSSVAEGVILLNLDLHARNVNLADKQKMTAKEFASMIMKSLK